MAEKDTEIAVRERLWYPLYDRQAYAAAGQTSLDYFAVPRGQSSKTYADTNMWTGGVLPTGKAHRTHAIRIVLPPDIPVTDAQKIFKNAYLLVKLNDSLVVACRAELFTAGCGIYAMSNIAAAATEFQAGNGMPAAKEIQSLGEEPLVWDNEDSIEVSLNWPAVQAIAAEQKVTIYLDGYLYRNKVAAKKL